MKFKCPFCGDLIPNPTMMRVTCGKKECRTKQAKEYHEKYRKEPGYKKHRRGYMKEYEQRPAVKKIRRILSKAYGKALIKLKNNHKEEFDRIYKEFKRRYKNGKK